MYGGREEPNWYDTAQVCLNGHLINDATVAHPEHSAAHCGKCGARTITECENCGEPIRGDYHVSRVAFIGSSYEQAAYCRNCGEPYPWTVSGLAAAREFAAEIEGLSDEDRETLSRSLDDLVSESPATIVAVSRYRRIIDKAVPGAADGLRSILVEIVSEAVRKQMWG